MEEEEEFFTVEARQELLLAVGELRATIDRFEAAVLTLPPAADSYGQDMEQAVEDLAHALATVNEAETAWSGEMSFWPADLDDEEDFDETDSALAPQPRRVTVMLRGDLIIRDPLAITDLSKIEFAQASANVIDGVQAALPKILDHFEQSVEPFADLSYGYAAVSGQEWERPSLEDQDEVVFEPSEDPDLRSFFIVAMD